MRWTSVLLVLAAGCGSSDSGDTPTPSDAGADTSASANDAGSDGSSNVDSGDAGAGCTGTAECERVIFVTSKQFTPDLINGVANADALCNTAASATNAHARVKGRKFHAWLSAKTTNPATTFVKGTKPYVRPSGGAIASDFTELTSGTHGGPIDESETGEKQTATLLVWTGTGPNGLPKGSDCEGWTSKDELFNATVGQADQTNAGWTDKQTAACNTEHRLYCVEE